MKTNIYPWIKRTRNKGQRKKEREGYYKDRERFQRFYQSAAWQRMRLYILAVDPFCNVCKYEIATEVDHIIPIAVDYSLRLDETNLQQLCRGCHQKKTVQDTKERKDRERNEQIEINMNELNAF